eukprot:gb/GECH01014893.1/.p1 GENE.gb/GECH01014893.1/~~gb/GECH01014893.1/.p1  ORF type:complete len:955 (+),score=222.79 gb/GECH01014893.1/:1-2865(+)
MGTEMMWSGKSTSYGNGLLYVAGARNIYVLSIESLEILTSAELYAHEKEPEKKLVNTSINGEYIAVTDDRYDIHIFHVLISRNKSNDSFSVSLKQIRTIDKPHTREITGISFSQDASFLISCSKDRKAKLWNLEMNHEKKENKTIKHEENQEDRMKRISAYDFQLPCPQPIPGTYRGCSFVYTKNSTKTNENKTSESKLSIVLCIAGGRRVPSQLLLIDGSTGQVTKTRSIKGDRITAFSDVFRNGVHHVFIGTTSGRLMGFEADSLRRTFRCPGNGAVHDAVTACALEPSIRIELDSNIKDHHHNRNNNNNNNNSTLNKNGISADEIYRLTSHQDYVTIECDPQNQFIVPEVIIQSARLIKRTLQSGFKESSERRIVLSTISPEVMEEILRFLFMDYLENRTSIENDSQNDIQSDLSQISVTELLRKDTETKNQRVSFLFELKPSLVMDILLASHYLIIPNLLKSATRMLADNIFDVPTFKGLPKDTVHAILGLLSPFDLCKIESDPIFEEIRITESELNDLWKYHAFRGKHHNTILERQTDFNTSNEDIDWKRQFIEAEFEERCRKLIIKDFQQDENEFLEITSTYAPHIRRLSIDPCGILERNLFRKTFEILSSHLEELELNYQIDAQNFFSLATQLAQIHMIRLRSLHISDAEIQQQGEEIPLFKILKLPQLQKLHITESRFDAACSNSIVSLCSDRENFHVTDFSLHSSQFEIDFETIASNFINIIKVLGTRDDLHLTFLDLGDIGMRLPKVIDDEFFTSLRNIQVKHINLDTNQLSWVPFHGGEVTANFVTALLENPCIQTLDMGRCKIGGDTFTRAFQVLANNHVLKELIIPGNTLYEESIESLVNMLQQNTSIECLHLANDSIRSQDLSLLLNGINSPNTALRTLYLHRNKITPRAALAFIANLYQNNRTINELSISIPFDASVQEFLDDLKAKFPERNLKLYLDY